MTTLHKAAQAALEALEHCREVIVERGLNGNEEFAAKWSLTLPLESSAKAINDLRAALAQNQVVRDDGMPSSKVERELRRMLCIQRHGSRAYMDDGEAQWCGSEGSRGIDYMRETPEAIQQAWRDAGIAALAQEPAQPAVQKSICTDCSNSDSWGLPDKPVCRGCASGSAWAPLNHDSVNPNKPAQPAVQECGVGVACLEKMRVTMTRLGLATDESLEGFGASLEDNIYSMCRTVNRILDKLPQPAVQEPAQQVVDSDEKAGAYMEARLWEFIDMAAAWPKASPDPRTWNHVMVYAPKPAQQVVTREGLYEAISHGDEKHRTWLKAAIANHFAGLPPPAPDAPQPAVQEPATSFDDPRVQLVYETIIDADDFPPKEDPQQHWDGWIARRIVDKLFAKRLTDERICKLFDEADEGQEASELMIAIGRRIEAAVLGEKP